MAALLLQLAMIACMQTAIVNMLQLQYNTNGYTYSRRTSFHTMTGHRLVTLASTTRVIDSLDSIKTTTSSATSTADEQTVSLVAPPSAHILPVFNRNKVQVSVDNPYGERSSSKTAAVDELLGHLTRGTTGSIAAAIQNSSIHQIHGHGSLDMHQQLRVEYLIKYLESVFVPIQTVPFLNLAMEGHWRKVYSNLITPHASASMQCELYQTIQCKNNEYTCEHGVVIDKVAWWYDEYIYSDRRTVVDSFPTGANVSRVESHGTLSVYSNYSINSKGELDLTLSEHVLHADALPRDLDRFFLDLQRSVPFDSFDPNATCHKTIVSAIHHGPFITEPMLTIVSAVSCLPHSTSTPL